MYNSIDELKGFYGFHCGDHPLDVPWDEIVEILNSQHYCSCGREEKRCAGGLCETGSWAIVRLRNGSFGVIQEDSDTTGHG